MAFSHEVYANKRFNNWTHEWKVGTIVFHPIRLKIPLCSCGKLKILFLAVFETGLVCNESEEVVCNESEEVVYVYFLAYLLAYSVSEQVRIHRFTFGDIALTVTW